MFVGTFQHTTVFFKKLLFDSELLYVKMLKHLWAVLSVSKRMCRN